MKKLLNFNMLVTSILVVAMLIWAVYIPGRSIPREVAAQETPPALVVKPVAEQADALKVAQAEATIVEYTLRTMVGGEPAMAFVGVGGEIDGVVNPELVANVGDIVRITVINGDPVLHDMVIDEFGVATGNLIAAEESVTVEFVADRAGEFAYYCSIPGHRQVGMQGVMRVEGTSADDTMVHVAAEQMVAAVPVAAPAVADAVSIVRHPTDLPGPVGDREPQTVRVELTAVEVDGVLADGTTYRYMTFGGQVPGPMIRVREGDTVELHFKNDPSSQLPHSIDLHAVKGPGGGAVYTQNLPGVESAFSFKALQPGLYVYHCATTSIPHHISSGMYGLILVEPEGGLPAVDHEFYVMQGEIYTAQPFGTQGHLDFSHDQMLDEQPEYFVFNGAAGALTADEYAMNAEVGDTVRIYFGVGGPNFTSSLHMIGEIFDYVYDEASLTSAPLTDVQTTLVPPGGATMVEFTLEVPGRYILVDHALSRLERGLVAYLNVTGAENPEIFHSDALANMAGH